MGKEDTDEKVAACRKAIREYDAILKMLKDSVPEVIAHMTVADMATVERKLLPGSIMSEIAASTGLICPLTCG